MAEKQVKNCIFAFSTLDRTVSLPRLFIFIFFFICRLSMTNSVGDVVAKVLRWNVLVVFVRFTQIVLNKMMLQQTATNQRVGCAPCA